MAFYPAVWDDVCPRAIYFIIVQILCADWVCALAHCRGRRLRRPDCRDGRRAFMRSDCSVQPYKLSLLLLHADIRTDASQMSTGHSVGDKTFVCRCQTCGLTSSCACGTTRSLQQGCPSFGILTRSLSFSLRISGSAFLFLRFRLASSITSSVYLQVRASPLDMKVKTFSQKI